MPFFNFVPLRDILKSNSAFASATHDSNFARRAASSSDQLKEEWIDEYRPAIRDRRAWRRNHESEVVETLTQ